MARAQTDHQAQIEDFELDDGEDYGPEAALSDGFPESDMLEPDELPAEGRYARERTTPNPNGSRRSGSRHDEGREVVRHADAGDFPEEPRHDDRGYEGRHHEGRRHEEPRHADLPDDDLPHDDLPHGGVESYDDGYGASERDPREARRGERVSGRGSRGGRSDEGGVRQVRARRSPAQDRANSDERVPPRPRHNDLHAYSDDDGLDPHDDNDPYGQRDLDDDHDVDDLRDAQGVDEEDGYADEGDDARSGIAAQIRRRAPLLAGAAFVLFAGVGGFLMLTGSPSRSTAGYPEASAQSSLPGTSGQPAQVEVSPAPWQAASEGAGAGQSGSQPGMPQPGMPQPGMPQPGMPQQSVAQQGIGQQDGSQVGGDLQQMAPLPGGSAISSAPTSQIPQQPVGSTSMQTGQFGQPVQALPAEQQVQVPLDRAQAQQNIAMAPSVVGETVNRGAPAAPSQAGTISAADPEIDRKLDMLAGQVAALTAALDQRTSSSDQALAEVQSQLSSLSQSLSGISAVPAVDRPPEKPVDPYAALDETARKAVQASLARLGYYKGAIDGDFGPGTRSAIDGFAKAIGAEEGKPLGPEQIDLLHKAAALAAPLTGSRAAASPAATRPGTGRSASARAGDGKPATQADAAKQGGTATANGAVANWILRGAQPGVAWVQHKNRSELIQVQAGEQLDGMGAILEIRETGGRWEVVTEGGVLRS